MRLNQVPFMPSLMNGSPIRTFAEGISDEILEYFSQWHAITLARGQSA
jgi:hypothetical protein